MEDNMEEPMPKMIPVGPDHQAFLPLLRPLEPMILTKGSRLTQGSSLTQGNSSSFLIIEKTDGETEEFEWLGTQIWPPFESVKENMAKVNESESRSSRLPGQGRDVSCTCFRPGSVECVRLHVKEADDRLKTELGLSYYQWGFPEMGEKYAESWTEAEENNFVSTAQWYSRGRNASFWDLLNKTLPERQHRERVCYYFNVFVLRIRAAQNRLYPEVEADSDDDETDIFDVESEGSEEVFDDDDGVLSSGELDDGEGSLSMEVDFRVINDGQFGDLSTSIVHSDSSVVQQSPDDDYETTNCSSEKHFNSQFLEDDNKEVCHTLRKEEETDMEDSEEEQHVNSECWEKQTWEPGLHFREVHTTQSNIVERGDCRNGLEDGNTNMFHNSLHSNSLLDLPLDGIGQIDHCEIGSWVGTMNMSSRKGDDPFISTNGVMKELFGDSNGQGWEEDNDHVV